MPRPPWLTTRMLYRSRRRLVVHGECGTGHEAWGHGTCCRRTSYTVSLHFRQAVLANLQMTMDLIQLTRSPTYASGLPCAALPHPTPATSLPSTLQPSSQQHHFLQPSLHLLSSAGRPFPIQLLCRSAVSPTYCQQPRDLRARYHCTFPPSVRALLTGFSASFVKK